MTDDNHDPGHDTDAPTQVDASVRPMPDLGPKFEVLGRIGAGSMGAVYKVRHRELDHVRAVKVVTGRSNEQAVQRLRQEAAIATRLAHPNIVTVYDLERLPGGGLGIVMEYLEGVDLATHVRDGGPLVVDDLTELFSGVADALDRMHEQGVVHRDLKPANLFLCSDGTVKILDFGISRHLIQDEALTETGHTPGTPMFMAPEQFAGEELSGRTDVYALGAVMYLCLTGTSPVSGTVPAEVVAAAMFRVPPRADRIREDVPEHVASALARALAKKPERRPASATALLGAVAGQLELPGGTTDTVAPWMPDGDPDETPDAPPEPAGGGRRRSLAPLLALLAAVLLLGAFALGRLGDRAADTEETTDPTTRIVADEPVRGGVLRVGASTSLPSLDPLVSDVSEGQMALCRMLFDTLVTLDWTGEVQPLLAESWTVEDGQRTFTFQLQRDVVFHDDPCFDGGKGRAMTAADVKATLERVLVFVNTQEGHPLGDMPRMQGLDPFLAGEAAGVAGIETPDDHTLVVRFERPNTEFLHILSWLPWSITAREAIQQYAGDGDLGRDVVGTGPYHVERGGDGADLVLVAHPGAWQRDAEDRQLPFPERIEVHTYKSSIAASTSFKEGRVDLVMGAGDDLRDEFFVIDAGRATARPEWGGYQAGGFLDDAMREQRVMLLDARSESPLLADARIRRAIGLAIQREEVSPSDCFPTDSPLVDAMIGHEPRADADPEGAMALLEEAGYESEGMPPLTICGTGSFHDAMNAIEGHLEGVGIVTTVIAAEPRGMHRYFTDGGCDGLMLTMMGLVVNDDLVEYLISYGSMVHLEQRNPDYPAFVERARMEGDPRRRAEVSLELARMLEDDAMLVVLAQRRAGIPDYTYIASPRVGGLTDPRTGLMNPLRERLHQLWLRPDDAE